MSVSLSWVQPSADDALYAGARRLRYELLRRPLGMGEGTEEHPAEARARHLVAVADGEVVAGCVMFLADEGRASGKLLQMAVAESHQGTGVGRRLVRELERAVAADGIEEVHMHARVVALGFYEKLGYAVASEVFTEVGIPHRVMRRRL